MNNEPVALTQGDILGILQDANSVPLGQPIFNSSEEYNKLKAIIESAIRYTHPSNPYQSITDTKIEPTVVSYTHPVKEQGNPVAWRSKDRDGYWCIYQSPVKGAEPLYTGFKELTDEEITAIWQTDECYQKAQNFARAILKKATKK